MDFDTKEWLGNWENFELYFTDGSPAMVRSWEDAEKAVKENKNGLISAILFRHGAKRFWQDACYTVNKENPTMLGGWNIAPSGANDIIIDWIAADGKSLGHYEYGLDMVVEKGLEGKPNFLLKAKNAPEGCPFRYMLSMPPMPEHEEKNRGGLISHLHFQYSSDRDMLVKVNGKLRHPHWYATMCDRDATLLQRCNIVRAMHKLDIWDSLPE